MIKYIVCFLCLFFYLEAAPLRNQIIKEAYLSKDFINYKLYEKYNIKKEKFKQVAIKLHIDKRFLENKTYSLKVVTAVNDLLYANIEYEKTYDSLIFDVNKDSPEEIVFYFVHKEAQLINFGRILVNDSRYKSLQINEGLFFGIAYAIIFCAFLYNFILFLYTFEKAFIYYSLMQLSALITLYLIPTILNQTFFTSIEQMIIDQAETFASLFAILFTKEILNTKNKMKRINTFFNFLLYVHIVDLLLACLLQYSILYLYLPRSVLIASLVLAGSISYFKGTKSSGFYVLGWCVLLASLFITEYMPYFDLDIVHTLHIGLPMESLVLTFALGYKLKETIFEKKEKEKMYVHQSKLASMGEMINNIAHQWRQPLSHISYINMNLQLASDDNDLSKKYLEEKLEESNNQLDFMSKTIDNFKDFYKLSKIKEEFFISMAVQKAIDIIHPSLVSSNIKIKYIIKSDKKIKAIENEYSQVLLNLLKNAKDALVLNKITDPLITVIVDTKENKSCLSVSDNAGGINPNIIEKIFEPYFTTKQNSSGIGLYMSKMIIETHFSGELSVSNDLEGARFCIEV